MALSRRHALAIWAAAWLQSPALHSAHGPGRVDSILFTRLAMLLRQAV